MIIGHTFQSVCQQKNSNFLQKKRSTFFVFPSKMPFLNLMTLTLCFFVFLCFHKQTKQTLEVLSFMKLEQIIFAKEAVSFMKTICVSPKLTTSIVGLFFYAYFPLYKNLKAPIRNPISQK